MNHGFQHATRKLVYFHKDLLEPYRKKIYKYITSILKNVYIGKLNDIVNKYNKTLKKEVY